MAEVRKGRIDILAIYKLHRLWRSMQHLAELIGQIDNHRTALVATSQGTDTTSENNSAGRLQLNVLMAVAEFERDVIVEHINAGLAQRFAYFYSASHAQGLESGLGDGHTCSHSGVIHLSVSGSGYGFDREGRLLIRRGEDRVFREPEDIVDLFAGIALPFGRDIDLVNIRPDMVRLYTGGCGCWGLESGPRTPDIVRARPSPVMSIQRIPRFEIVTDRLVFPGCFPLPCR